MTRTSVYFPLSQYLHNQSSNGQSRITMTFEEIENIIRRKLPATARKNRAWWANSQTEKHRQCSAWLNYDWETEYVDFLSQEVSFHYIHKSNYTVEKSV
jgi:hypothetical protein